MYHYATDIVKTGSKKVVAGEGMTKADGSKGDLIIVFDIFFPKTLSPTQRDLMRAVGLCTLNQVDP